MPGIDGIDLCRLVRGLGRDIRPYILMLSARDEKKDLVKGFQAGADDYVPKPFDPDELEARLHAGRRIVELQIESLAARDSLRRLASHDFLTGIRNRNSILEELQREFDRSVRTGKGVAVAMADLDHFKQVNDTYGHPVGDKVLAEVARRMAAELRSYEAIGRYGGEEFLIVLSECDLEGAECMAQRVRNALASKPAEVHGALIPVTVSIGVAATDQWTHPTEALLVELADFALYKAKRLGRNRVELAEPPESESGIAAKAAAISAAKMAG
jgi:diguanylate cyclase (GGDEF)-like protein